MSELKQLNERMRAEQEAIERELLARKEALRKEVEAQALPMFIAACREKREALEALLVDEEAFIEGARVCGIEAYDSRSNAPHTPTASIKKAHKTLREYESVLEAKVERRARLERRQALVEQHGGEDGYIAALADELRPFQEREDESGMFAVQERFAASVDDLNAAFERILEQDERAEQDEERGEMYARMAQEAA